MYSRDCERSRVRGDPARCLERSNDVCRTVQHLLQGRTVDHGAARKGNGGVEVAGYWWRGCVEGVGVWGGRVAGVAVRWLAVNTCCLYVRIVGRHAA